MASLTALQRRTEKTRSSLSSGLEAEAADHGGIDVSIPIASLNGSANTKHLPPYIHFTLQKTNRETQDAIGHISRALGVNHKELSVAGTKDKRAITYQRVSLRRGRSTLESVWKATNNIHRNGNTEDSAMQRRGDRGCRVGDIEYAQEALELGHLKGNRFTIALR